MTLPLDAPSATGLGPLGRALIAAGVLLFVAAGGLMWWRHGDAVFASYVQAALAWCF